MVEVWKRNLKAKGVSLDEISAGFISVFALADVDDTFKLAYARAFQEGLNEGKNPWLGTKEKSSLNMDNILSFMHLINEKGLEIDEFKEAAKSIMKAGFKKLKVDGEGYMMLFDRIVEYVMKQYGKTPWAYIGGLKNEKN